MTTIEYFEKVAKQEFPNINIEQINVSVNTSLEIIDIMKSIRHKDNIFLDITGGMRDAVFNITLISRFAEFNGNVVEKVLYCLLAKNKSEIKDFTSSFKLMNLLNGVSEFVSFASMTNLGGYFKDSKNKTIKILIEKMTHFTESITLGKINNIEKELKDLQTAIYEFEKAETNIESELIFKYLIKTIETKFFKGIKIDYLSIIEWCLENKLVQQALTLYTEKIPLYLFEENLIKCSEEYKAFVLPKKSREMKMEDYYFIFWSDFLNAPNDENISESEVKNLFTDMGKTISYVTKSQNIENEIKNLLKFSTKVKNKEIKNLVKSNDKIKHGLIRFEKLVKWIDGRSLQSIRKTDEKPPSNLGLDELWETIKRQNHIVRLCDCATSNDVISYLMEIKFQKETSLEKKIRFIKNFDKYISEKENDYKINDIDKIKRISKEYVFFKTIRNEINHASNNENLTESQKNYFKEQGFNIEISLNNIIKDMKDSLKKLRA